jgi:predicted nucleic acid-binding protein
MMRQRIYIETTVWYQMVNYSTSEFKENSQRLLQLVKEEHYELYISNVVLEEISLNSKKYRERLEALLEEHKPIVLMQNGHAEDMAAAYVENAFKGRERNDVLVDMMHMAVATTANISYVSTYNYRNLLKVGVLEHVNVVNLLAGCRNMVTAMPPYMFLDLESFNGEKGEVHDRVWELKDGLGEKLRSLAKKSKANRDKYHQRVVRDCGERLGLQAIQISSPASFV